MSDDGDFLAAAEARVRALAEQLAARPVNDVVGFVDEGGKSGLERSGRRILLLTLRVWRHPSGPVKTSPLHASIATTWEAFDSLWERIEPLDVIRLRARIIERSAIGDARAEIVEFLGHDPDPELRRIAAEARKPAVHRDPTFGDLVLDRAVGRFSTWARWEGVDVELSADVDEAGSPAAALDVARFLWINQGLWSQQVRDHAVREILSLKNAKWLEEDEPETTREEFLLLMKLKAITVHPDGAFDFRFDVGDLFYGASIQIGGALSEGPRLADVLEDD